MRYEVRWDGGENVVANTETGEEISRGPNVLKAVDLSKKLNQLETLVNGSFLRNVPAIMLKRGCSIEEAIQLAYERDVAFLSQLSSRGVTPREEVKELRRELSGQVYDRIKAKEGAA